MWNKTERSTLGCGKENERVSPAAALDWDLFVADWLEGWCSVKMIRKMWKNTLDKRSVIRSLMVRKLGSFLSYIPRETGT